jgi:hypothetical protein
VTQPGEHRLDRPALPFDPRFDAPVVEVADPARDAELASALPRVPAERDALDGPADEGVSGDAVHARERPRITVPEVAA